jgi:CRISPR/Cas system-associated exonuclease Cas4 (RecB family)
MVERHFRGFSPEDATSFPDDTLRAWWHTFQRQAPVLPVGTKHIEYTLTVPILGYFLTGRFDLMVVDGGNAHIFDWKTESFPRSAEKLQADLQTQLYLAMAVAGGKVLTDGVEIAPENVKISYWYVNNPAKSVTLSYNERQHRQNWENLEARVAAIAEQFEENESVWALTDNLETCQSCPYQLYCGRLMPAFPPQSFEPDMLAEIEPDIFTTDVFVP